MLCEQKVIDEKIIQFQPSLIMLILNLRQNLFVLMFNYCDRADKSKIARMTLSALNDTIIETNGNENLLVRFKMSSLEVCIGECGS